MAANPESYRGTIISVLSMTILAAAGMVVMFALCGGLSVYTAAVIGGVIALGCLHYLWWGRALSRQVAGEREETEIRDRMGAAVDPPEEDPWERRF